MYIQPPDNARDGEYPTPTVPSVKTVGKVTWLACEIEFMFDRWFHKFEGIIIMLLEDCAKLLFFE
jgi:hypothetical protein